MPDLSIKRDTELDVACIEANTDAGADLTDGWLGETGEVVAVDAGRIIIPEAELPAFLREAESLGLSVETEKVSRVR